MTAGREQVAAALPGYEIGGELGRGGWGVVLAGRHRQLRRDVAIKQLPAAFAADPAVRDRFIAEARVLASLDHPHVVPVFDYVESGDVCLLVMENLPGGTVWRQFSTSGISMPGACAIVLAACSGLHAAHQKGILHRDVKPENLMYSAANVLKVTDFGISKVLSGSETMATKAGDVLGTPAYMAPEQVLNKEMTPATDVYAVGMMLYELLSGKLPFPENDPLALLFCQVNDIPAPLDEVAPSVPEAISAVTMKALAKDPKQRYATAEDLGVALAEAATESWNPGWLQQSDVRVIATGRMAAVTMHAQGPTGAGSRRGSAGPAQAAPAPATVVAGGEPEPESPAPPVAAPAAPVAVIRARAPEARVRVIDAAELNNTDLVSIEQVVRRPPRPVAQTLSAVAFLLVCIAIAFVGLGSSTPKASGIPPGSMTVAGTDVTAGKVISVDLGRPLVVAGHGPEAAAPSGQVKLTFTVAGIPVGHAASALTAGKAGQWSASIDASRARYLVPSETTTQLSVESGGTVLAETSFLLKSRQFPLLTVPGVLAIALVLFSVAYTESLLRGLRRRRKLVAGRVGVVIMGGVVGALAVVFAWLIAGIEPTRTTAIVCALLGAVAGTAAGMAATRIGVRKQTSR